MLFKFYHVLTLIIFVIYINEIQCFLNKQKKIINLAFPVNNKYINFLYIALVSLLENSNKHTIYNIFIQIGNDCSKKNLKLIIQLEKIYFNCFIHIIDMKNDFYGTIVGRLDISAYYRLKLPILCPQLNRIIHIDSDTLILKDLMELYTLNFEGKYILGRLDILADELDSLGVIINNYINTGVLLIDLYNLRKYNYTYKFMEYIYYNNNHKYLIHHDQTLLNFICHDKIGILRPKYHMWPFRNKKDILNANKAFRIPYKRHELFKDLYDPFIIHFPGLYKVYIKERGGIFHEKYYKYSLIAEERKRNIKFGFTKKFKEYFIHLIKKILFRYQPKKILYFFLMCLIAVKCYFFFFM